jgi:hypothetical protein
MPVEAVIGPEAARNNGARPGMTAGQFAQQWISRFEKGSSSPSAQPVSTVPASGSINGVALSTAVPTLLQAAMNPNLPKAAQETARMLLGKALDQYPEEIRKLEIFKQRPDLFELAKDLKQAGATTIDQRGEGAEAAAIGKAAGERAAEVMKASGSAPKALQNLARMESLLAGVHSGKIEPSRMNISAWAKSLGMDDNVARRLGLNPESVGTQQAITALSNELAIGKIGAGGFPANNFSDADRSFITSTVPQLANTPQGNALMIEANRRLLNLDIEKGKAWQAFRRSNKGRSFDDFEVEWNDKIAERNLFGDLQQRAASIVGGQSPAGTPSPTVSQKPQAEPRRAPDGNFYIPDPARPGKYLMVK